MFEIRLRHFIVFRTYHGHENVIIIKKVCLFAQSETVRLYSLDMLGHEFNSKFCLRNAAVLVVCRNSL